MGVCFLDDLGGPGLSYTRYVINKDGKILGFATGSTREAVLRTKLPDGIEHIEEGKPAHDVLKYRVKTRNGEPVLDKAGKIQFVIDLNREIEKEIARAKEEAILELVRPRVSQEARSRINQLFARR